jgi:predicted amidohydrolase
LIDVAGSVRVDLIVFPELSLTGYELDLAADSRLTTDDPRIEPLRRAAKEHDMHVLVGGPWASGHDRPYLGAFLLSPGRTIGYAKIHVHESESAYFIAGTDGCVIEVGGESVGVAICADTSHPQHAADAAGRGVGLYVASVMKTEAEYTAHASRLEEYASRHRMAVLTANYAGATGGAESAGKSAVWNERGELVARADSNATALVLGRRSGGNWRGEVISDL